MHHFYYRNGELYAESVPVNEIAKAVGTPCYIYSHATLTRHFNIFNDAFSNIPHLICYSVKANSNLAILRLMARMGAGMDIVSGGELFCALKAGVSPDKIVFSGVGKTKEEIEYALKTGILMFNVESEQELEIIHSCAKALKKSAPIAIRVNPDIDPRTHPYISTGLKRDKFGIDINKAEVLYKRAASMPYLHVIGIDCHIGSQLTLLAPFLEAIKQIKDLYNALKKMGIRLNYIDIGGGLGIPYHEESPPHPYEYANAILELAKDMDCCLILEPGRVIVGNAGILLTKMLYFKKIEGKNFIIVDAGMNDLIRPSLYNAYHAIWPCSKRGRPSIVADIVGPICESGDFFARDREIETTYPGELLAIMSSGAYGFSMSSNYNSRPRPAEVLVKGERFWIIRDRESYENLISLNRIPQWLR
ncbi:MAG: diaminopimelate decarboxylase [Deltaproteobacteria bacterium]|nr:diaminopimelate decarboxylase [Deltaproteobacteria bacterium]